MGGKSKIQRNLWEAPWGYVESFFIGAGLLLSGFSIEYFTENQGQTILSYPLNLYVGLGYVALLVCLYAWFTQSQLIRWLTKVPASITSIVFLTIMVMIMGIVPQVPTEEVWIHRLGLNSITTNWAFLLILFLFLTCLGLVTIKRLLQFKWSNWGFILNHLGLFLALIAGVLGSGDLERLSLNTYEGKTTWIARDGHNHEVELPFAIRLNDFQIEEYQPKLAVVSNQDGKVLHNDGKNLYLIEEGADFELLNMRIQVKTYLPSSGRIGDRYAPVNELGASPSAMIQVTLSDGSVHEGWISCGSFISQYQSMKINDEYSLVMTIPEAKKFSSDVTIISRDMTETHTVMEVNKPFNYKGFKLYQLSYDERLGKWSDLSVIELVRDPWLPWVYLGIFMLVAGAVHMFWVGNKSKLNN